MKHLTWVLIVMAHLAPMLHAERHLAGPIATESIFVEALGNGLVYSLNYEHLTAKRLVLRVGGMFLGKAGGSALALVGFRRGEGWLQLEGGVGVMLGFGDMFGHDLSELSSAFDGRTPLVSPTAALGLRIQPPRGGFLLRLTFTPLMGSLFRGMLPWGGISIGFGF